MTQGMRISLNNEKAIRAIIMIAIVAFMAFSDRAYPVYAVKVIAIVMLFFLRKRIRVDFYLIWICLFVGFSALSILWAPVTEDAVFYTVWALQAMMLALAIENTIDSKADIEYVLKCLFFSGIVLLIRVMLRTSLKQLGTFRLGTNMGMNANELALKSSIAFISGYYLFRKQKKDAYRILYFAGIALLMMQVVFTGSRKGSIMVVSSIFLYAVLRSKTPLNIIRNLLVSVILGIGFIILITQVELLYNAVGRRLSLLLNMFDADAYVGNSISNRRDFIETGFQLFLEQPFGYGMGSFQTVSGARIYAHNNYIELLVDVGLIGFAIYYALYIRNIVNLLKILRKERELLSLLFSLSVVIMVLEYGLVSFQSDYVQIVLAMIYASIRIVKKRERSLGQSLEVKAE